MVAFYPNRVAIAGQRTTLLRVLLVRLLATKRTAAKPINELF